MSWLSDTAPLVADGWLSSAYAGHGIRGADVPSSGANGPAILYPGLVLPDEADDEFRALILTRPATLPGLVIYEDSSLDTGPTPPDGVHQGTWRGYKNGQIYGPDPSTYTITIGAAGGTLSGGAALDGPAAAGGLDGGAPSTLSGGATLDGPTAAGGLGSLPPSTLGGDATLDGPAASGGLSGGAPSVLGGDAVLGGVGAGGSLSGVALFVPSSARTFVVFPDVQLPGPVPPATVVAPTYLKDPDALLDYSWDLRPYLNDSQDALAAWTASARGSAQIESQSIAGAVITLFVSGVNAGEVASVHLRFSTQQGRADERTIYLQGAQL